MYQYFITSTLISGHKFFGAVISMSNGMKALGLGGFYQSLNRSFIFIVDINIVPLRNLQIVVNN